MEIRPRLLAITSGKGGVGKTTISVGLAHVISAAARVLIVDLDLLNRGLSELVGVQGTPVTDGPELRLVIGPQAFPVELRCITPSIYCLLAVKIDPTLIHELENNEILDVVEQLRSLVMAASAHVGARSVIMDCHGSADTVTRAAALMADDTLVVCVPEIITFFGTKQILGTLRADKSDSDSGSDSQLHIVFNRVGEGFTLALLTQWSAQYFSDEVDDPVPLAAIPSDEGVSIATAVDLVPTRRAAYAVATEKIRLMVASLYRTEAPYLISAETKFVDNFLRLAFTPRTVPFSRLLDPRIPMRTLMVFMTMCAGLLTAIVAFPQIAKMLGSVETGLGLGDILLGLIATYSVFLALGLWSLLAYIVSNLITIDSFVSGASAGRLAARDLSQGFAGTLGFAIGVLFMFALAIDDVQSSTEAVTSALPTMLLPAPAIQVVNKLVEGALTLVMWSSRCYLAIFLVVFFQRSLRALLYRFRSAEVYWRSGVTGLIAWTLFKVW